MTTRQHRGGGVGGGGGQHRGGMGGGGGGGGGGGRCVRAEISQHKSSWFIPNKESISHKNLELWLTFDARLLAGAR